MPNLKYGQKSDPLTEQINTKWSRMDVKNIDAIAKLENRDRSYVVRFLVRWSLHYYELYGSLPAMDHHKKVPTDETFLDLDEASVNHRAQQRFELRKQASDELNPGEINAPSKLRGTTGK